MDLEVVRETTRVRLRDEWLHKSMSVRNLYWSEKRERYGNKHTRGEEPYENRSNKGHFFF